MRDTHEGTNILVQLRCLKNCLCEEKKLALLFEDMNYPRPLQSMVRGAVVILGGITTLNLAYAATLKALHVASENKRKKVALPCRACRGKGFYICKLCKGNATISWSPIYDPIAINPCLCPTCDGNRVQRCLNCLGKGYD